MTVLAKTFVPGLTREQYEELGARLTDQVKSTPGFIAHYAWEGDGGMNVVEIWESAEQHDAWFNDTIRPNLPAEATQEKHELINTVTP
ncbi:antibiotic biosynthesis monooxygenase family protein [Arthrobacter sp. GCM10027362]|uniref:antibiotic biosynthesis monooxygenase family protein n=1 Tax=Arthrobacter sp. GCM10027362 TaxID=3273379 RepID=UPI003625563D